MINTSTSMAIIFSLGVLTACGNNSATYETSEVVMRPSITIDGPNENSIVRVVLKRVNQGETETLINLARGDELVVHNKDIQYPMVRNNPGEYLATVPAADAGVFRVSLNRSNHVSAPNTTIEIPKDINLVAPVNGVQYSPGDSVEILWNMIDTDGNVVEPDLGFPRNWSVINPICYDSEDTIVVQGDRTLPIAGGALTGPDRASQRAIVNIEDILSARSEIDLSNPAVEYCNVDLFITMNQGGSQGVIYNIIVDDQLSEFSSDGDGARVYSNVSTITYYP